jgi:hypothetical protein
MLICMVSFMMTMTLHITTTSVEFPITMLVIYELHLLNIKCECTISRHNLSHSLSHFWVHLDINIPPRVEYGNKVKGALQTLNPTHYKKNKKIYPRSPCLWQRFCLCFTKGVRLFSKCGALGFSRPFQTKGGEGWGEGGK